MDEKQDIVNQMSDDAGQALLTTPAHPASVSQQATMGYWSKVGRIIRAFVGHDRPDQELAAARKAGGWIMAIGVVVFVLLVALWTALFILVVLLALVAATFWNGPHPEHPASALDLVSAQSLPAVAETAELVPPPAG